MRANLLTVGCLIIATLANVANLRAEVTSQQVRQAIEDGVAYLKARQHRIHGNWPGHPAQPGGLTALCILALLNAGVDRNDPSIMKALEYLRRLDQTPDTAMTYSTSLQIMAFCAADPDRFRPIISRNAKWLERTQIKEGERRGSWGYSAKQGRGDNSNTQFAILALHEAERVGVKIDPQTWRDALGYWLRTQKEDGAWGYLEGQPSTGSMTCAGIASVVIAAGKLNTNDARVVEGRVMCCGNQTDDDPVRRALDWLGRKFSVESNPSVLSNRGRFGQTWLFYYLYGVERVGRLTGQRFIGKHDWYREGAEYLVNRQDTLTNFWKGYGHAEENPLVATPLALLFLSKGRRPVVISKLKHGSGGIGLGQSDDRDWDHHRNGVQNLTRSIESKWKTELTWQTIDARAATVEDLLQSPVLFISGKERLELTAEQKENLRDYVNQGGFLFAEACCGGKEFDASFRQLMKELFPNSALRLLPTDHPVWFAESKVNPKYMRPLHGIEACCRTSVVYCPEDLSCYWELGLQGRDTAYPQNIQEEIESCLRTGENVVAYATNRVLRDKLDEPPKARQDLAERLERGMLYVPKIRHGGGSDDAPNALPNLLQFMQDKAEMRVSAEHLMMSADDPSLYDHPIIYMHGRRSFQFSPTQRKALATYFERGGFLIADSICASPEFTESFRREIGSIFPGRKLERISPKHELFSREYGGFDLSTVTLRDPKMRVEEGERLEARMAKVTPLLEGLQVDNRLLVVFSPNDLSCGLENHTSLECKGYIKSDAAKIGLNLILFGLQQ